MTMNGPDISKISFLVISMAKTYRSKSLISYLEKQKLTNLHVPGIPSNEISIGEPIVIRAGNSVGSKSELACSLSHIAARSMGLSLNEDWIFVLEDDAIILDQVSLSNAILDASRFFSSERPIAVHFFPAQFGVFRKLRKNKNFLKVLKVPDSSVATLYSKGALVVSSQSIKDQIGQLSDYPKVLKSDLRWFAVNDNLIDHPAINDLRNVSYIREDRIKVRQAQKKFSRYEINVKMRYLIFLIIKLFSKKYTGGMIETKKLRSRVLWF